MSFFFFFVFFPRHFSFWKHAFDDAHITTNIEQEQETRFFTSGKLLDHKKQKKKKKKTQQPNHTKKVRTTACDALSRHHMRAHATGCPVRCCFKKRQKRHPRRGEQAARAPSLAREHTGPTLTTTNTTSAHLLLGLNNWSFVVPIIAPETIQAPACQPLETPCWQLGFLATLHTGSRRCPCHGSPTLPFLLPPSPLIVIITNHPPFFVQRDANPKNC